MTVMDFDTGHYGWLPACGSGRSFHLNNSGARRLEMGPRGRQDSGGG